MNKIPLRSFIVFKNCLSVSAWPSQDGLAYSQIYSHSLLISVNNQQFLMFR